MTIFGAHSAPSMPRQVAGHAAAASTIVRRLPVMLSSSVLTLVAVDADDVASVSWLIASATAGALCGSLLWFAVGRRLGRTGVAAVVRGVGRYAGIAPAAYRRIERACVRSRVATVVIGQISAGGRGPVGLAAGATGIGVALFLLAATPGILIRTVPPVLFGATIASSASTACATILWASASAMLIEAALSVLLSPSNRNLRMDRGPVRRVAS